VPDDLRPSQLLRELGEVLSEGAAQRWKKRLAIKFSGLRAANVTTASLDQYVAWCREQGLANATINRDLAALKRAFNLAWRSTPRRIKDVPTFPHLKEAAPRAGFVEEPQYRQLAANANELWLRALLATAYAFGFRKGELLNLRLRQINLIDRTIRVNAGETKSGEGRVVVMTNDVYLLLQACCACKDADGFVFTRSNGEQVRDFRETWENLVTAAKTPPACSFTIYGGAPFATWFVGMCRKPLQCESADTKLAPSSTATM
jgi:integrase